MVRIKLQLFAYTGNSIVDYLKSVGKDSSFSARKKMAENNGIINYSGTADQNIKLLNSLRSGTANTFTKNTSNTNKNTSNVSTTPSATKPNGVDQALWDTAQSPYTQSQESTNADKKTESVLGQLEEATSQKDIVDQKYWDALNSKFEIPSAVLEADAFLSQQLKDLQSGKTSWSEKYGAAIDKYLNREKFEYDVDKDQMFQQALASAMNSGKSAMQDTIGQASALTGGYGSTYATSAGNQAYNAFIEDAYNNLPEYYQMALQAYQAEGEEMFNQVAMLGEADANEYAKMVNSFDATFKHRNQIYNDAYTQFRDSKTDAYNAANLQLTQHGQYVEGLSMLYDASQDYSDTLYEREYNEWYNGIQNALNMAGIQQKDHWDEKTYDQTETWNQKDLDFKNAQLDEEKRQFNISSGMDANGDGTISQSEIQEYNAKQGENGNTSDLKTPTQAQKNGAKDAYNTGGDAAFDEYISSLPSNVDVDEIFTYVYGGTDADGNEIKGYGELPLEQRTYTKTKDTFNWLWGVDGSDVVEDQYGYKHKIKDLPKSIRKELTKLTEGQSWTGK